MAARTFGILLDYTALQPTRQPSLSLFIAVPILIPNPNLGYKKYIFKSYVRLTTLYNLNTEAALTALSKSARGTNKVIVSIILRYPEYVEAFRLAGPQLKEFFFLQNVKCIA